MNKAQTQAQLMVENTDLIQSFSGKRSKKKEERKKERKGKKEKGKEKCRETDEWKDERDMITI